MASTRKGGGRYPSSPRPANQGRATSAHVQQPKKSGTPTKTETTPETMCQNLCTSISKPGHSTKGDGSTARTPGTIC